MEKSDEGFNAYHRWLGIPPKDQPANHYRLLGLELFESDAEVIRDAAVRQIAHVRTYHLGQYSELSQKILNEIAAAKVCLSNPTTKETYDRALRQSLAEKAAATAAPADSGARGALPPEPLAVAPAILPPRPRRTLSRWWNTKPKIALGLAVGAIFLAVLFGAIVKLRTSAGLLALEISEPDVTLQVFDAEGRIQIERKAGKGLVEIGMQPGKHRLCVWKDAFAPFSQHFAIAPRACTVIRAKLVPLAASKKPANAAPLAVAPAASGALAGLAGSAVAPSGKQALLAAPPSLPTAAVADAQQKQWQPSLPTVLTLEPIVPTLLGAAPNQRLGFPNPIRVVFDTDRPLLTTPKGAALPGPMSITRLYFCRHDSTLDGKSVTERDVGLWVPVLTGPCAQAVANEGGTTGGAAGLHPAKPLPDGVFCFHSGILSESEPPPAFCCPFVIRGYGIPQIERTDVAVDAANVKLTIDIYNAGAGALNDGIVLASLRSHDILARAHYKDRKKVHIPPIPAMSRTTLDMTWEAADRKPGRYDIVISMHNDNEPPSLRPAGTPIHANSHIAETPLYGETKSFVIDESEPDRQPDLAAGPGAGPATMGNPTNNGQFPTPSTRVVVSHANPTFSGIQDKRIADATAAIQRNPNDRGAYMNRASAYVFKHDYDRAIADYNQVIRSDPESAMAYRHRGDAYRSKNEMAEATADYTAAIRIDPNNYISYIARASLHFNNHEYNQSLADFSEAIRLRPNDAHYYRQRAEVYETIHDTAHADADRAAAGQIESEKTPRGRSSSAAAASAASHQLAQHVTLSQPYPRTYTGARPDRISLVYAVAEICHQVGLKCDLEQLRSVAGVAGGEFLHPTIKHMPASAALDSLLRPFRLSYEVVGGELVLTRAN